MDIVVASDGKQLTAQRRHWLALQDAGGAPSPFQEWGWVEAWQRHFGDAQAQPLVLMAQDASGPQAVLPLQLTRAMGVRIATWLSSPAAQYGGVLMRPMPEERRNHVYDALWQALSRCSVDVVDLPLLPADDPFVPFLQERCRQGPANVACRVDLSAFGSWREYELSLKPSTRRARRKRLNRLKRAGDLSFAVRPAGPENRMALDRALAWKRGWLKQQGLEGALPLHEAFADLLADLFGGEPDTTSGEWVVAELALDGAPIAVEAGMVAHGIYHSWFAAYDPALAEHSPGKAELWLMLQWCKEHRIDTYDMLPNPAPYKREWANAVLPLRHFIAPLSAAGRAHALWLTQARPLARRMHGLLPPALRARVRKWLSSMPGKH